MSRRDTRKRPRGHVRITPATWELLDHLREVKRALPYRSYAQLIHHLAAREVQRLGLSGNGVGIPTPPKPAPESSRPGVAGPPLSIVRTATGWATPRRGG